MAVWLFRRVGVDVHFRDRYYIVGRIPVIVLCLLPLGIVVGVIWLVLVLVRTVIS